jgi:hypothetical protein
MADKPIVPVCGPQSSSGLLLTFCSHRTRICTWRRSRILLMTGSRACLLSPLLIMSTNYHLSRIVRQRPLHRPYIGVWWKMGEGGYRPLNLSTNDPLTGLTAFQIPDTERYWFFVSRHLNFATELNSQFCSVPSDEQQFEAYEAGYFQSPSFAQVGWFR